MMLRGLWFGLGGWWFCFWVGCVNSWVFVACVVMFVFLAILRLVVGERFAVCM